jgi:L-amino acid N-acyltransferase YncA
LTPERELNFALGELNRQNGREATQNGFHKLLAKLFTDNTANIRFVERRSFSLVGIHHQRGNSTASDETCLS